MKRILGLLATLFAVLVLTTGCYRLTGDLKVTADDTVSGSMIIAVAEASISEAPDLNAKNFAETYLKDATFEYQVSDYKADGYQGVTVTFDHVAYADLNFGTASKKFGSLQFKRVGDNIVFDATLETVNATSNGPAMPGVLVAKPDIRFSLEIPGTIKATNGTESDMGLTWVGDYGQALMMHAETWAPLAKSTDLLPVAALIVVFIVILAFNLSKPKNKRDRHVSYE